MSLQFGVDVKLSFEHDYQGSDFLIFGLLRLGIGINDPVDLFQSLELFEQGILKLLTGSRIDSSRKDIVLLIKISSLSEIYLIGQNWTVHNV